MKSILKACLIAVVTLNVGNAMAQDKIIEYDQLPLNAKTFIKTNFNKERISYVSSEKEFISGTEYKVVFQNGGKIEFDGKGNWKDIDNKLNPVPSVIVPTKIQNYVNKSFPDNKIVQISKDKKGYDIELTNGIDLEFSKNGTFTRIDD